MGLSCPAAKFFTVFISFIFTPRILVSVYFRAMTLFMRLVFALLVIRSVNKHELKSPVDIINLMILGASSLLYENNNCAHKRIIK